MNHRWLVALLIGVALFPSPGCTGPAAPAGVDSGASEDPLVCSVSAPTECPATPPHYADVQPIVAQRCVVCHSDAAGGPWPLTGYRHVADWQDTIRSNLLDCSMPPPEAAIPMTNAERLAILVWIRCGALP